MAEPTFNTLLTAFSDFLVVAIHTILYERSVYPQTSFLSARKYNYAVRQSRHPRVCTWILDAVAAVSSELAKGTVSRVAVVIFEPTTNRPLERFMFDLSRFPHVPEEDANTTLEKYNEKGEKVPVIPQVDLEEQLRGTMARISGCGALLRPIPEGCTFTVAIELKDDAQPPIGHPQPWIPTASRTTDEKGTDAGAKTVPVRSVAAGDVMFEVWIEEGEAKAGQTDNG